MICKKRTIQICLFALALWLAPAANAQSTPVRQRLSFNSDWRFQKDDPPGTDGRLSYETIKDRVTTTGDEFIAGREPIGRTPRTKENLGSDVAYTKKDF